MAEKFSINHFCHEHPLVLTENVVNKGVYLRCFACWKAIVSERAYVCVEHPYCSNKISSMLHQRCAELPTQILHSSHPHHPLYLFENQKWSQHRCHLCHGRFRSMIMYRCRHCNFNTENFTIDITCKRLNMDELFGERCLDHPRHLHPLTAMRKPSFSFTCDACGVEDRDMAYSCSTCNFLIHKTCAFLPISLPTNQHHHQLSLASCFPIQFRKYTYQCAICDEDFTMAYWVYYCGDCRYFVHLKCATSTKPVILNEDKNDGSDLIKFPVSDISKVLITPFVMGENGVDVNHMPTTVNMPETIASYSYLFNYHNHSLSLVSGKLALVKEEDEDEDEDEDEELKICDVCVTPISSPPYYECAACKYFVHLICYSLPKTLPSSSSSSRYGRCLKINVENHKFTLYTSSKKRDENPHLLWCQFCGHPTNGMVYMCEECGMIVDVKCASLPTAITHASHSHPNLVMTGIPVDEEADKRRKICHCCGRDIDIYKGYRCSNGSCDFALDFKCALLPPTIRNHEWDKHPLLLTFDASPNHPSDFICEFCEEEMHPKKWMYHCSQCDNSFHIACVKAASGLFRDVKFGRRFELDRLHPHPLTHSYITRKKWCDICRRNVYSYRGFECASCNYVVCMHCGDGVLANKM